MHNKKSFLRLGFLFISLVPVFSACELSEACHEGVEYKDGNKCETCPVGSHINKTQDGCEQNTNEDCGAAHKNCKGIENAINSTCDVEKGSCKLICNDGYVPSASGDQCLLGKACSDVKDCGEVSHAINMSCPNGVCTFSCEEGYHVSANHLSCRENLYTSCNEISDCKSKISGVAQANCRNNECQILSCENGFHPDEQKAFCDVDINTACGSYNNDCTTLENAIKTDCKPDNDGRSQCVITECTSGFHPSENSSQCLVDCPAERLLEEINMCYDNECDENNIEVSMCAPSGDGCAGINYLNPLSCIKANIYINSKDPNSTITFNNLFYLKNRLDIFTSDNYKSPKRIEFPKLEYTGGLSIGDDHYNDHDNYLDFSSLVKIGTDLKLSSLKSDKMRFPKLEYVANNLELINNQVAEMSFDSLKTLNANLLTRYNKNLSFPALEIINNSVSLSESRNNILFPKLSKIQGDLSLTGNGNYQFESLETIGENLILVESMRPSYDDNEQRDCYSRYTLGQDDTIVQLNLPKLKNVKNIVIKSHPFLSVISLPSLEEIVNFELDGKYMYPDSKLKDKCSDTTVSPVFNQSMKNIEFPNLKKAKLITISGVKGVKSINMPELVELESLTITCEKGVSIEKLNMPKLSGGVTVKLNGCNKPADCNLGQNECVKSP